MAIHGGGWIEGAEGSVDSEHPPISSDGLCGVVNVEYRLGKVSLAPAVCALHSGFEDARKLPLRSQQSDCDWRIGRRTLSSRHGDHSIRCGIRK